MKKTAVITLVVLCCLTACSKSAGPAGQPSAASTPAKPPDGVTQKLQEHSGANATDCGRLDISASQAQLKTASDCALQASQGKHPFYVAYDMPGMSVGVAGGGDGKLYTVQSQGTNATPTVTSGDCPAQLRVASSGRVHLLRSRRHELDGSRPWWRHVRDGESARFRRRDAAQSQAVSAVLRAAQARCVILITPLSDGVCLRCGQAAEIMAACWKVRFGVWELG